MPEINVTTTDNEEPKPDLPSIANVAKSLMVADESPFQRKGTRKFGSFKRKNEKKSEKRKGSFKRLLKKKDT